jgi:D-alanyl-D-alanine carboxypeptidase
MKNLLKKLGIAFVIFVLLMALGFAVLYYKYLHVSENHLAHFIQQNPTLSSMVWIRDGKVQLAKQENKVMPLASTVKIILAIEYAQQVAAGKQNPEEMISLVELEHFHIKDTDGGAHPGWLEENKSKISGGKIALHEVVKGMIHFSSNANTEWLMHRLGLEAINANLEKLQLRSHTPIYPIVGALLLLQKKTNEKDKEAVKRFKEMPMAEYISDCQRFSGILKKDTVFKQIFKMPSLGLQRIWSDRLPAASAQDYASLMSKIVKGNFFEPKVQNIITEMLEWPMGFPENQKRFKRLGGKGGSTAFVLTTALYSEDKQGHQSVLVFMFDGLNLVQQNVLESATISFEQDLLGSDVKKQAEILRIFQEKKK